MPRLNPEQIEEAITLYVAGESTITLADRYDTSVKTVALALRKRGVELRDRNDASNRRPNRRRELLSELQQQEVVDIYQDGYGVDGIAAQFSVTKDYVRTILKRNDIAIRDLRKAGELAGIRHRRFSEEQEKEMVSRYEALESASSISRSYGTNPQTVSRILRRHGITTRGSAAGGLPGELNPMWRGGVRKKHEYLIVAIDPWDPMASMAHSDGCIPVHRLVMARSLGRPLTSNESVHHIDGDPKNNDISNLQLRQGKHGNGIVMQCLDCGSHNLGPIPIAERPLSTEVYPSNE